MDLQRGRRSLTLFLLSIITLISLQIDPFLRWLTPVLIAVCGWLYLLSHARSQVLARPEVVALLATRRINFRFFATREVASGMVIICLSISNTLRRRLESALGPPVTRSRRRWPRVNTFIQSYTCMRNRNSSSLLLSDSLSLSALVLL